MFENMRLKVAQALVPKVQQKLPDAFLNPLHNTHTLPRLGTRELLEAYGQMPWLRAIVKKVGQAVSEVEWKVFVETGPNGSAVRNYKAQRGDKFHRRKLMGMIQKQENLLEIPDHPILDFLEFGNELLFGQGAMQVTQNYYDLVGEAFWLLERNGAGMPIAYWPVPSHWVRQFPSPKEPFFRIRVGVIEENVPVTEVISFIDPDPANPYGRGLGTAKALADELETDEYASKHLKNFFHNRARPDVIISGDNISPADTQRMEEKWLQKHQSFWNSFKPQFLSRQVQVTELGQTFEHMQMLGIRSFERDTIIQVYGVPPEKLGIVNESKRSTIAAADFFWTKDIIEPRLEDIRVVLQNKLVPQFDERIILDYESPVVQDDEHRMNVMSKATWAFTSNEWRDEAQKDTLGEDGDFYMMPANAKPQDLETIVDTIEADDPERAAEMAEEAAEAANRPPPPPNGGDGKDVKHLEKLFIALDGRSDDIEEKVKNSMMLQKK